MEGLNSLQATHGNSTLGLPASCKPHNLASSLLHLSKEEQNSADNDNNTQNWY